MNKQDFTDIYTQHFDDVFWYIYSRTDDWLLSEDYTQDIFTKILQKKNVHIKNIKGLLIKMAKDLTVDLTRKEIVVTKYLKNLKIDYTDNCTDNYVQYMELNAIHDYALTKLKPIYKDVYLKSLHKESTNAAMAEKLGISEKAIEKRLRHARSIVRSFVINVYEDF